MYAQISITANVGTEVEVRPTRNAQPMATFRVASTPRYRSTAGDWTDGDTTWMTVRCYRGLADNVAGSLRKGDPVVVVGRIRTATWNDDKGVRHERAEIEATSVGHDLARGTTHFRRPDRTAFGDESTTGEATSADPGLDHAPGPGADRGADPAEGVSDPWATGGPVDGPADERSTSADDAVSGPGALATV